MEDLTCLSALKVKDEDCMTGCCIFNSFHKNAFQRTVCPEEEQNRMRQFVHLARQRDICFFMWEMLNQDGTVYFHLVILITVL